MSGGGSTSTQTNTLAPWMEEAAKTQLGKATALTDINQNPYQQYGGQRIAGFQPLQNKAFEGVNNLQTAGAVGQGINAAGEATGRALNTSYNPYQTGQFGAQAGQYMDPYMQNVVDIQQREAQRQADIAGTQRGAEAVKSGAFGGGRQAIMDAEAARNLATQKGDIQARGLQDAYGRAQQQFNTEQALGEASRQYGAGLGLKGLETAISGASQLGGLGSTQFGQQKDIINAQQSAGAMQQAQEQAGLSQGYEDFLAKQKYPYQQMEFMSNIMRGTPYGSTTSMYSPGATTAQTLGSLGTAAYGLSKLGLFGAKEGGSVSSYAGGGSVDDAQSIEAIVDKLSDMQLRQAAEAAQSRGDAEQLQIIQQEMASRASERGGMMGAFNQLPQEQQQKMMAGGGIVAFAQPTAANNFSLVTEPPGSEDDEEGDGLFGKLGSLMASSEGNPEAYKAVTGYFPQMLKGIAGAKYTPMSDDKYNEAITNRRTALEEGAGPSPYADIKQKLDAMRGDSAKELDQAKGLAALQAAAAMSQGRGFTQGLGRAGGAFAESYGQAVRADAAQKRALMNMEVNAADAMRKERMGLNRDAISAADQARRDHDAAQQFGIKKAQALANVAGKFASATKPTKVAGAGGPKPLKLAEQLAAAEVAHETNPSDKTLATVSALRRAVAQTKTSDYGPTRAGLGEEQLDVKLGEAVTTAQQKLKFTPEYLKADPAGKAQMMRDEAARVRANAGKPAPVNNNSPRPRQNDYSNLWGGSN